MKDDFELLREFAETGSEQAFAGLVERYQGLVYSAALRQTRDPSSAQEVTQAVLIALARKARSFKPGVVLAGWLFCATRFASRDVLKSERRRMRREQLAYAMNADHSNPLHLEESGLWEEITPVLDESLARLGERDRHTLLLRFFQQKKLADVGQALGLSEAGARKGVDRALQKLRTLLQRRGVMVPIVLLGGLLATHGAPIVPSFALSGAFTASAGTATLVEKILAGMAWSKAKIAIHAIAAGIMLLGAPVFLFQLLPGPAAVAEPANPLSNAVFVVRGKVRDVEGRPLAQLTVRLATADKQVRLFETTNPFNSTNRAARTDFKPSPSTVTAGDGSFTIGLPEVPREGRAVAVVKDDAGYAIATAHDLVINPEMVVQPWGRIEGVLRIGQAIATNHTVNLSIWGSDVIYEWNLVSHWHSVRTDAQGRFVFSQVPPIDVWLTHDVEVRPGDKRISGHQHVRVGPGEKVNVQLGGKGRVVMGRVDWADAPKFLFHGSLWAEQRHWMRQPRGWKSMSIEERRQYEHEWRSSAEGDLFKEEVCTYEFPVRADGTFQIPDVLPGSYRLQVRAEGPPGNGLSRRNAAEVETKVLVPGISPGDSEVPLDIGALQPSER